MYMYAYPYNFCVKRQFNVQIFKCLITSTINDIHNIFVLPHQYNLPFQTIVPWHAQTAVSRGHYQCQLPWSSAP